MKNISKLAAIFLYFSIMSLLLHFKLTWLVDLKQIGLVLIGMFILFLPGYRQGEERHTYANQLARCALYASYIQTFILLFVVLSKEFETANLVQEIALNCRPLLYGFCLWVILSNDTKETAGTSSEETASEEASYRALGLTNREAQLAVLIAKGLSNAQIAATLNISETTVKKHISNIFEKLDINKREDIRKKLP